MVGRIRPIGDGSGLVIDKAVLDLLNLRNGSSVDVSLAPGGKGILIMPAADDVESEKAAHKARVRAAGDRVMERHASAFKKLAE